MPPTESLPSSDWAEDPARLLIERAQAGDRSARDAAVAANLGLVRKVVGRFAGSGLDLEDLFQWGCIGLIKAVDRFDLSLGVRFSTYAVPLILGEIRRFLRDDGPVKVARPLKLLALQARRLRSELAARTGRDPSLAELATALGCARDELVLALDSARQPASLDEPVHEDDGEPVLRHEGVRDPAPGEASWLERVALQQGLSTLQPRERLLLTLRFFKGKTQMETAQVLGISQVQVSRLERKALERIRNHLEPDA